MIIGDIVKNGLEFIGGELFGRIKDKKYERNARKKQESNVQNIIDKIISDESNSPYYDVLQRVIDNSTVIKDLIMNSTE